MRELLTNASKKALARLGLVCARSIRATDIDLFDLVVRAQMQHPPEGRPFFFLQIGANDGQMHDPIRGYVDEFQWHGLLVEPIPSLFKQLVANYANHPQLLFENCAIGPLDGSMTLYKAPDALASKAYARGLASFDKNVLLKHKDLGLQAGDLESVQVPCMSIDSLLAKHGVQNVDLLQIDTEGFDYEVLKLFNFSKMRPTILQFEHVHLTLQDQISALNLLRSHGYNVSTTKTDAVAVLGGKNPITK